QLGDCGNQFFVQLHFGITLSSFFLCPHRHPRRSASLRSKNIHQRLGYEQSLSALLEAKDGTNRNYQVAPFASAFDSNKKVHFFAWELPRCPPWYFSARVSLRRTWTRPCNR